MSLSVFGSIRRRPVSISLTVLFLACAAFLSYLLYQTFSTERYVLGPIERWFTALFVASLVAFIVFLWQGTVEVYWTGILVGGVISFFAIFVALLQGFDGLYSVPLFFSLLVAGFGLSASLLWERTHLKRLGFWPPNMPSIQLNPASSGKESGRRTGGGKSG